MQKLMRKEESYTTFKILNFEFFILGEDIKL